MVKKHISLPRWLNSYVKELVQRGHFQNEAEVIKAALMLMATSTHKLSPEVDTLLFEEIANYIGMAKKHVQEYRLPSAIEYLRLVSQTLSYRMTLSIYDDPEFINNIRPVNIVLADCIALLGQMVKRNLDIKQLNDAIEECEIMENLDFLSETYKGLVRLKYQEGVRSQVDKDRP